MKLIAKVTIRSGGVKYGPGSVVEIGSESEAASLIERGFATEAPIEIECSADGGLSPTPSGDGSGERIPEANESGPLPRRAAGRKR